MYTSKFYRKDGKWEHNTPPPRFRSQESSRGHRTGISERGRGRGRGRGMVTSQPQSNNGPAAAKKPPLIKQNSSDLATEEWETASETSDKCERLVDAKDEDIEEKREKKSFSSQRPNSQNRRDKDGRLPNGSMRNSTSGKSKRNMFSTSSIKCVLYNLERMAQLLRHETI